MRFNKEWALTDYIVVKMVVLMIRSWLRRTSASTHQYHHHVSQTVLCTVRFQALPPTPGVVQHAILAQGLGAMMRTRSREVSLVLRMGGGLLTFNTFWLSMLSRWWGYARVWSLTFNGRSWMHRRQFQVCDVVVLVEATEKRRRAVQNFSITF